MEQFYFDPVLSWWQILLLLAAAVAPLLLRPAFDSGASWQRWPLVTLRAVVILLLLIAILRPTILSTTQEPQTATILVLFDATRSTTIQDEVGGQSRWEAIQAAIRAAAAELRRAGETFEIRAYAYDAGARNVAVENGEVEFPPEPTGDQTDHGGALDEAVQGELGKRLAAVFLLGDGIQAAYAPEVDAQQVVRDLRQAGCPLYTIHFGQPSADRDIALENLLDQYRVFVNNELVVKSQLRISGFANKAIPVRMVVEDGSGQQVGSVAAQRITATPTEAERGEPIEMEFKYIPTRKGNFRIRLIAEPQEGEFVLKNNELSSYLTVLDGGLRILYIESSLDWFEPKFVARAIDASQDVQLDFLWVDRRDVAEGVEKIGKALAEDNYDIVILGDVHAEQVGSENLALLAERVDAGRGFMTLGGYYAYVGGYSGTPLERVLPVELNPRHRQDLRAELIEVFHAAPAQGLQPVPGQPHFITDLAPEEQNLKQWLKLPPQPRANRFDKLALRSTVLLKAQGDEDQPLLVAGVYGGGRVLSSAMNGTWRWQMNGFEDEHKRFWRRAMLWLARKDQIREDVWIDLPQRRFNPGQRAPFTAGVTSSEGGSVEGARLEARLIQPDESTQNIVLVRDGEQFAGALTKLTTPGVYQIEVVGYRGTKALGRASAEFTVYAQDLELSNPSASPQTFKQLALMTAELGGGPLTPDELGPTLAALEPPENVAEVQRRWRLLDTAWDAWLFLLLIAALLGGEWYLRKRWGMV